MRARYLVRFDDLCPTMRWDPWEEIEDRLMALGIRPLLAVVPDNRDPQLEVDPPNEAFWDRVRTWQARGWTIGLHGYQHAYLTGEPGIVGLNRASEFAGLPPDEQEERLSRALETFRRHGVRPEVWVAPAHSFDRTTLHLLSKLGIGVISDGMGLYPHRDPWGMFWIPQQLWRFRPLPFGVWTVCCHHNAWSRDELRAFCRALEAYQDNLADVPTILERYGGRSTRGIDRVVPSALLALIRTRRWLRSVVSTRTS